MWTLSLKVLVPRVLWSLYAFYWEMRRRDANGFVKTLDER